MESLYQELGKDRKPIDFYEILNMVFEIALHPSSRLLSNNNVLRSLVGWGAMGLSQIWTLERVEVAEKLKSKLERWCRLAVRGGVGLEVFCGLMRTPAMRRVRLDSIVWLADSRDDLNCDHEAAGNELVKLLEEIFTEEDVWLTTPHGRTAFSALLGILVAKHNGRAILLARKSQQPT